MTPTYWLTRFMVLRLLGLVYFVAFLVFCQQGMALLGSDGLLPAVDFLPRVAAHAGSTFEGAVLLPSLFWLDVSDTALMAAGWIGLVLSFVVLCGYANSIILLVLWALYLSIVHVGQLWYGYGWESQLCETGFLAVFLVPLVDGRPFPRRPPPVVMIWLLRWLTFRIMLGAGLIKLRGDQCWRDLTCLEFHYETQPIPNPLSRWLHFQPAWLSKAGVVFNHVAELVAPWFIWWPRVARHVAGAILLAFQVILILSGNLSFLNWLTIVPILACFDDGVWRRVLPRRLVARAERAAAEAVPSSGMVAATMTYTVVVAFLSIAPVQNLLSSHQAMNTSFDPLNLVNTYGAFGSVGRERPEIVFEGTRDATIGPETVWEEYEFPCKPGDVLRRPCVISPYHYRLDWQIWFAAMASPQQYPWTVHFVWKLLHADPGVRALLARDPFGADPPRWIRARLYRYQFAPPGEPAWWTRTLVRDWLPPLAVDDPALQQFVRDHGWTD